MIGPSVDRHNAWKISAWDVKKENAKKDEFMNGILKSKIDSRGWIENRGKEKIK